MVKFSSISQSGECNTPRGFYTQDFFFELGEDPIRLFGREQERERVKSRRVNRKKTRLIRTRLHALLERFFDRKCELLARVRISHLLKTA
jgi:hypothetical protein